MDDDEYDYDYDLRAEAAQERRERARWRHWCEDCHGHTGPGSPCVEEPPEAQDEEDTAP